jgi:hypothetical protein
MPASNPSPRRRVPVRLLDVPLELRLKAAREVCRHVKTERERDDLLAAALVPKETVFYVTDVHPLRDVA